MVDLDGAAVDMIRRGNIAAVLRAGRGRCGVILCRVTGRVAVPRDTRESEFSTGGWHEACAPGAGGDSTWQKGRKRLCEEVGRQAGRGGDQ